MWDTALKFFIPVLRSTSPDHLDEVVWVQEEEKQDYYTWSSTGTETGSDGEPKRNEKNWESHGETSDSEATDNSDEEIDDGSQRDVG